MNQQQQDAIIEQEVKERVQREMDRIDFRRIVDELQSQIIEQHMRDYTFPPKSIPMDCIDLDGFTLDQEQVQVKEFKNFKSTGIKDTTTAPQIEVTDDGLVVNNLHINGTLDISGNLYIGDEHYRKIMDLIYNEAMKQFKVEFEDLQWCKENIADLHNKLAKKVDK